MMRQYSRKIERQSKKNRTISLKVWRRRTTLNRSPMNPRDTIDYVFRKPCINSIRARVCLRDATAMLTIAAARKYIIFKITLCSIIYVNIACNVKYAFYHFWRSMRYVVQSRYHIARVFFQATLYHFILDVHTRVGAIQHGLVEHLGAILTIDETTARNKLSKGVHSCP